MSESTSISGDDSNAQPEPKPVVGSGDYEVQKGDCLSSIAYAHGVTWQSIWNDPANADLKTKRKNPNVLLEGDLLTISPIKKKEQSAAAEKRHPFTVKGTPAKLRLRLLADDQARANEDYTLDVEGKDQIKGTTDGDGRLECGIPPTASTAILKLQDGSEVYRLDLGALNPFDEPGGVQQRLNNLGFYCGDADGIIGKKTHRAIKQFQKANKLDVTGDADDKTMDELRKAHDGE